MVSMPHIASESAGSHQYEFSFAWDSPYGHAVRLIEKLAPASGVIIDIGAGYAAIAAPLVERGYEYVGVDIDDDALSSLGQRGFEAHKLDLGKTDQIATALGDIARGRDVVAVLLLDVIEHMPSTRIFLKTLRDALDAIGRPLVFMSVPNVSHIDVAAKLVFGRWDYTETGLLDATHVQLFTGRRLHDECRACGLLEIGADDFQMWRSDQYFPPTHPGLSPESPAAQLLCDWRELADPHAHTVQFVRAFAVGREIGATNGTESQEDEAPFATVVMRTQGTRLPHLREALTCLAAQSVDAFDVLVMVHTDDAERILPTVTALVAEFDASFASRVEVVRVAGGGRARPLNAALERVRGDYVVFLDDDDVVTADWIESFQQEAHDGAIVRSTSALRRISASEPDHIGHYVVDSGLEFPYEPKFDFSYHFWGNDTPICTFAIPRQLIDLGIRFDERLAVLEDWDFFLRCVALAPVRDTGKVTSVYQMWRSGESSASLHHAEVWQATQRLVQEKNNQRPVLLPAGAADDLIRAAQDKREMPRLRAQVASLEEALARDHGELQYFRNAYLITIGSARWRVMSGPARMVSMIRRLTGRAK